jgi:hypothetical protein
VLVLFALDLPVLYCFIPVLVNYGSCAISQQYYIFEPYKETNYSVDRAASILFPDWMWMHSYLLIVCLYRCIQWGSVSVHPSSCDVHTVLLVTASSCNSIHMDVLCYWPPEWIRAFYPYIDALDVYLAPNTR